MSYGIGSEITWLSGIGLDDSISSKAAFLECDMYHVEHRKYRVNLIEIGYLTVGLPESQGVVWLGITVEDATKNAVNDAKLI